MRIGRNAMEAVVTAVNQDWGFLVIGAGSNSGFSPQTSMLVMRDGRLIARVRPSSIEPNQTIAEIDFKSMPRGRIQPGDRVMLSQAGRQLKTTRKISHPKLCGLAMPRSLFYVRPMKRNLPCCSPFWWQVLDGLLCGNHREKTGGAGFRNQQNPMETPVAGQGQGQFGMMPQNQYRR